MVLSSLGLFQRYPETHTLAHMPWRDQRKGHATRVCFTRKGTYFQCLSLAYKTQCRFHIQWSSDICTEKKNKKKKEKEKRKGKANGKERDM